MSWLWIVPLGGVTAVVGYMLLLFGSFAAEGLGGEVSASVVLLALGFPSVLFLVAVSAGLLLSRLLARFLVNRAWLSMAPPWLVGTGTAIVGGAVATAVYFLVFGVANHVGG